ncbi:rho GTPase-activating protein 11A isoform X2 [Archocentrus centrarchus]|uniref:rho GTPase-activating protein 11A isoform X2 n=1 Tax=Archocentrus centrarchus TaxID=63155 RepID=UPI0011EA484B|nr:rho GTPase-activating protein 11A-like isoform X2 [Archocentrus centrarchus]
MRVMEKNVMRLVAVQHLRSAYGIKTKNWNKNKAASCKSTAHNTTKVFGVPLENLPCYNMECGSVPRFLVDACMSLLAHVDTEGLFRKSGSVVRLKALRAKLDAGEECLSSALACDVAGLVKQFFRELPEPVLPVELQEAFLKAQQLPNEDERTSATILLSCVLPDRNLSVLRHFLDFLYNVSKRSAENKMDSSNLSVILAPNLLHFGDGTEKINANTEKRLKLQAAVVQCFIENAQSFGVLPRFLQEKVPSMMGCEAGPLSPVHDELEEPDVNSGMKRKSRRSLGVFTSATPVISTPASKRKLPLESGSSFGFSNKKRRSVKKNLGIELLPNILFTGPSTPGSACSTSGVLDSSQHTMPSAGRSRRQSATSARKKSRRFSGRHLVSRVESGRAGCFSPKVAKKEAPHKSLRLRFSLGGKSSKDAASESIGLRLATQESATSFRFTKEMEFIPSAQPGKTECKSSRFISKSEDNLLTPRCDSSAHRTSWCAETPVGAQAFSSGSFTDTPMNLCLKSNYVSEPAIIVSKPPVSSLPMKLCCASSAESLENETSVPEAEGQTGPTLLRIKKAFSESGSNLQAVIQDSCKASGADMTKPSNSILVPPPETVTVKPLSVQIEAPSFSMQQSLLVNEQNITFGQIEIAALSPLHVDSVVFEAGECCSPVMKDERGSCCASPTGGHNSFMVGEGEREVEQMNCSKLIDALDIQSPAHFRLGVSSGLQSTPYNRGLQLRNEFVTPPKMNAIVSAVHEEKEFSPETDTKVQKQPTFSPHSQEAERRRVADHIQHFNKLTLCSPSGSKSKKLTKSPLKFHRTPVRQTVCRIDSLLRESRKPVRNVGLATSQRGQMAKAVSLESGLSPQPKLKPHHREHGEPFNRMCPVKKPPPVPPRKPSTRSSALGDVTNKVQPKIQVDCLAPDPSGAQKPLQQVAEKDMNYYRGSPRNPLNQGRLLSATKPVDL